jgi:hypothetical protein
LVLLAEEKRCAIFEPTKAKAREMTDFSDDEPHKKPVTFMGAPYTHDLSGAKAAVLGVPFDCGVHLSA